MAHNPSTVALSDDEIMKFQKLVMGEHWNEVIEKYETNIGYHKIKVSGNGTALHIATNADRRDYVKRLVSAIISGPDNESLRMWNDRGATPLHLAAYRGFTDVCELIIGTKGERKYLIRERNKLGETPLFWAVCGHKILVYIYLQQFHPRDKSNAIDSNKTSILHIAIQRDMFDLAIIIMHFNGELINKVDKKENIPLAYLATRRSAFYNGSMLPWWKKILYFGATITQSSVEAKYTMLRYRKTDVFETNESNINARGYIPVTKLEREYNIKPSQKTGSVSRSRSLWKEIKTIRMKHIYGGLLFEEFLRNIKSKSSGDNQNSDIESNHGREHENSSYDPMDQRTRGETSTEVTCKNIELEDSKHTDGEDTTFLAVVKSGIAKIMEGINSKVPITCDKNGLLLVAMNNIKKEVKSNEKSSAFLNAASHGIVKMMTCLTIDTPSVIDETNSNDENALLLAVKNRQPLVIELLVNTLPAGVFEHLALQHDKNGNTMLHLAACIPFEGENTWRISGFALQMMWDIKWYKYIKTQVSDTFIDRTNAEGKTPSEIFKEDHKELLQKSVEWMRDTAESCSVVAALIAGVSFATSGSVPGGNQQSGEPTLEGQPAFEGFAISSLIGLYFSVISLIMFLSILTSRKEVENFYLDLPVKLLFGLSSLFVSIVSMLVSFCAGHFFVLTDKYAKRDILFYLYVSIFFPVAFYAFVQFPLFLDLVLVIFKKVPPPSIKGVLI